MAIYRFTYPDKDQTLTCTATLRSDDSQTNPVVSEPVDYIYNISITDNTGIYDLAFFNGTDLVYGDIFNTSTITLDSLDTVVDSIKAKTDNLPSDPADASDIASSFTTVNNKLDAIDDYIDTEVAAIKAKTDNLPSDPADQSAVEAAITAATSGLATASALNDVDNYIDTEIAAIKAKTDNLPASPAATGDIPSAATVASQVRTELTTELGRIDAAISTRLATSGYTAPDNANIANIKAKTDNLPSDPADQSAVEAAITAATSGLATASALNDVDNFIDTEVAAIKAVTDKLDTALEVDGLVYRYTTNALEQGPSGGGGGTADWTAGEKEQIRSALGVDGTKTAATGGQLQTLDTVADAIKAKTDNLPSDPADQSAVEAAITSATSGLATAAALDTVDNYIDTEIAAIKAKTDLIPASPAATGDIPSAATIASQVRTELTTELGRVDVAVSTRLASASYTAPDNASITSIKAKTDNLPSDPADQSAVESAITATQAAIIAEIDANETKIDTIDTNVDAIVAATDTLEASASAITSSIGTIDDFVDTEVAEILSKVTDIQSTVNTFDTVLTAALDQNTVQLIRGALAKVTVKGVRMSIIRGDEKAISFTLGTSWNLTGKKVYLIIKKHRTSANATAIVNRVCTITDAANGRCSITLSTSETNYIGVYYAELEVRNTDESSPETAMQFEASFEQDSRI